MDSAKAADRAEDAREIFLMNFWRIAGAAFLYWDHLITLQREVDLIWRRPKSLSSYCFLVNRYFAFATVLFSVMFPFFTMPHSLCEDFCIGREVILLVTQTIVSAIMIIRVWALYKRSKRVLWSLLVLVALVMVLVIWSMQNQKGYYPKVLGGCHWNMSDDTAMHLVAPWIALFMFDSVIFFMTIYNALVSRKAFATTMSLQMLVIRDGALYFGIVALANLGNIATYYIDNEFLCAGLLVPIASGISVTMMSRLILNLHEYAAQSGIFSASTSQQIYVHAQDLPDEKGASGSVDSGEPSDSPRLSLNLTMNQEPFYNPDWPRAEYVQSEPYLWESDSDVTRTGPVVRSI